MSTAQDAPHLDLSRIAQDLQLRKVQVEAAVQLLDEGNTPPFIARYRKDRAGGLDEDRLRVIRDRVADLRHLAERKQTILKTIEAQGKLTDDLRQAILTAETHKRVEDLYLPFKPKKRTPAAEAREKGLGRTGPGDLEPRPGRRQPARGPGRDGEPGEGAELGRRRAGGAKLILTEMIAETADVRAPVRFALWETGRIVSRKAEPKREPRRRNPRRCRRRHRRRRRPDQRRPSTANRQLTLQPTPAAPEGQPPPQRAKRRGRAAAGNTAATARRPKPKKEPKFDEKKGEEYRDYFDFTEGLRAIPPHRILAVNRGEKEHVLQVKLDWDVNRVKAAARSAPASGRPPAPRPARPAR